MIPIAHLFSNVAAFLLIGVAVLLPGWGLLRLLRVSKPLLVVPVGASYWALGMVWLPFAPLALPLLALLAVAVFLWGWKRGTAVNSDSEISWWALLLLLPMLIPLFTEIAPSGEDMTMHASSGAAIARAWGVPEHGGPMLPDGPAMRSARGYAVLLSLPTAAGSTLGISITHAAVALVCWSYLALFLAVGGLCQSLAPSKASLPLALSLCWLCENLFVVYSWGGAPTLMAMSLGIAALDLWLSAIQGDSQGETQGTAQIQPGSCMLLAMLLAGSVVVHAIPAAISLYVVGWGLLLSLVLQWRGLRRWWEMVARPMTLGGGVALILVIPFAMLADTPMEEMREWIRQWQEHCIHPVPTDEGVGAYLSGVVKVIRKSVYRVLWLWVFAAIGVLLWRRRSWLRFAALFFIVFPLLFANERVWWLPLSPLLYPERVLYWVGPFLVCVVTFAFHVGLSPGRQRHFCLAVLCGVSLWVGPMRHGEDLVALLTRSQVTAAEFEGLQHVARVWGGRDDIVFVTNYRGGTGFWIPAVANLPAINAHVHVSQTRLFEQTTLQRRRTHVWCGRTGVLGADGFETLESIGIPPETKRSLVYSNPDVRIFEIE